MRVVRMVVVVRRRSSIGRAGMKPTTNTSFFGFPDLRPSGRVKLSVIRVVRGMARDTVDVVLVCEREWEACHHAQEQSIYQREQIEALLDHAQIGL